LFSLHRFFFLCFVFWFFPACVVYAGSCGKAERPPETRHDCAVFLIASGRAVKNPSAVLEFAASSTCMTTPPSTRQEVTQLLGDWSGGDDAALERLFPLVQPELHRLAHHYMSRERAGHTLQTTAILDEAYLRLVDTTKPIWQGRSHFIAAAAQLMRRIMVDHARERHSLKRGGGVLKVTLDEAALVTETRSEELLALDEALERLAAQDPRKSQIVELRYFGGLTVEETAEFLKLSQRTVEREWTMAKAWLYRALSEKET
jgi:RNA polymerase sigma factor (TIGR02999 family)